MSLNLLIKQLRKKFEMPEADLLGMLKAHSELDPNNPIEGVTTTRPLLHIIIDEDDMEEVCYYLLFDHGIKANPNLVDEATNLTPLCASIQNQCSTIII